MIRKIPTTADIHLEVDGVRVAVVQSYRAVTTRKSRTVEAFGQEEPVATIRGASRSRAAARALGSRSTPISRPVLSRRRISEEWPAPPRVPSR